MTKMKCDECGWIYEPEKGFPASNIPPGTPWQDVSTDFVCPICNADKNRFIPVGE